ncbi:ankyrin repeat domain-containing protein, partial [Thiotrichales bacterium 19X7-9]|nr:ankyrin repeat domain-containing protein [Thiotrichales bacterium 19X7-9]
MLYRSQNAQQLHTTILSYICNSGNVYEIVKKIKEYTSDELKEKSINGFTHFMDIMHLPYEIHKNNQKTANELNLQLMYIFFNNVSNDIKKYFLLEANNAGFTPLHQALISGNPDNMKVYFNEIRQAVKQKLIHPNEYKSLLITPNQAGFTPLHEALISGNPDNMKVYFDEIRQAGKQGWITLDEYKSLLITPNQAGFTPLHEALISGNPDNMEAYFNEIRQAGKQGWITLDEYKSLLITPN